jgi:hypothetical protein
MQHLQSEQNMMRLTIFLFILALFTTCGLKNGTEPANPTAIDPSQIIGNWKPVNTEKIIYDSTGSEIERTLTLYDTFTGPVLCYMAFSFGPETLTYQAYFVDHSIKDPCYHETKIGYTITKDSLMYAREELGNSKLVELNQNFMVLRQAALLVARKQRVEWVQTYARMQGSALPSDWPQRVCSEDDSVPLHKSAGGPNVCE